MSALGLIARVFPVEGVLKVVAAGGALFLAFAVGSYQGFYQGAARVEQRLQKAQLETTATVLQTERQYRERENAIVKEYLDRIEVLKEQYEKQIINAGSLRDVFSPRAECVPDSNKSSAAGMPAAPRTKPGVKCYTEPELLRKIERSMAIARECDQLALRYQALLAACEVKP